MKVKLLRDCRLKDEVRGRVFDAKIGQEIDLDISEQGASEMLYGLLQNAQGIITDVRYVPLSARYLVLHGAPYIRADGSPGQLLSRQEVTLPQEQASKFLASGHVRPVDSDQWIPIDLIRPRAGIGAVKKMFDTDAPLKNFATVGMKRER